MIHVVLRASYCRSYYCCHFLWRHSRCTGITDQMASTFYFTNTWGKHQRLMWTNIHWKHTASISIILLTHPHTPPSPSLKKDEMTKTSLICKHKQECSEMVLLASSSSLSGQPHTIYPSNVVSRPGNTNKKQKQGQEQGRKSMQLILTDTFLN